MFDNLKEEINSFLKDLDENIKNKEDLEYVKIRTASLLNDFINELEDIINYKQEQLNKILQKQEQEELKLQELQKRVDTVYQDIYEDDEDFMISCPYCGEEFEIYLDEDLTEVYCPECGNIIELDWNGNPDDGEDTNNGSSGCGGNCPHCK